VGARFSRFELKIMSKKERAKMIRLCPFKEKEGGFPLVANGRRGRRFLCLEANGKRKRRFFFHLFPLSPQTTLFKPLFVFL